MCRLYYVGSRTKKVNIGKKEEKCRDVVKKCLKLYK